MGYTHYFSGKRDFTDQEWDNLSRDFNILQEYLKDDVPIVSDDPNGIIMNESRINFNDAHDDYETFYISKIKDGFGFCKTARHNYDLMVCATLLLIHHYAPGAMEISSDGRPDDWSDAMMVNARLFGYAYKLPSAIHNDDRESAVELENIAEKKALQVMAAKMPEVKAPTAQNNVGNIKNRFNL